MELEFGFEVVHVRDLGPVTNVLEDLVGLVESVLCREGFQEFGVNILLNEIVEIRECINVCKWRIRKLDNSVDIIISLSLPLIKKFSATETLSCCSFLVSSAKSREFWTWRKTSVRSLMVAWQQKSQSAIIIIQFGPCLSRRLCSSV